MVTKNCPSIVVLLGPPGSGKGTQAKRLSAEYRWPAISTGDLFREHIAAQTSIGKQAQEFIDAGQLVPDALVLGMLFARIAQPDCAQGYLLDGFPRTIAQADHLAQHHGVQAGLHVLCLQVPDEEIVQRAAGRWVCPACRSVYNSRLISAPPQNQCSRCRGALVRRPDDEPAVVRHRLQVYHAQTQPLIDYYARQGVLALFDGNQPPDAVYAQLKQWVDAR